MMATFSRRITVLFPALLASGVIIGSGPVQGADLKEGQALHEANCIACHASLTDGKPDTLYTRKDRLVNSLADLQKQVRRCELNLELQWFDDQIDDVVAYLNKNFYKFEQ